MLTSENNLRELETMYNQDLTDYRVAIAELESLVGTDLNVANRDPHSSNTGENENPLLPDIHDSEHRFARVLSIEQLLKNGRQNGYRY